MNSDSQANLSDDECRFALNEVISSDTFSSSERMRSFLIYIVNETLSGRADAIMAKTIAMDVYGRDTSLGGQSENVVRVDARRLRRYLEKYYDSEGSNAPIRIWVDRGGYVPRFVERHAARSQTKPLAWKRSVKRGVLFAAGLGVLVIASVTAWKNFETETRGGNLSRASQERLALRENSVASVEAVSLAEQARSFLFPLLEPARQQIALEMFRQVIILDPEYFGGYAGAAQTLTTLSLLTPSGPKQDAITTEAEVMLDAALKHSPTRPWTQSAAAWVAFGHRDYARAFELSGRSVKLAPTDGFILDFHGLISILTGHFEDAQIATDPERERDSLTRRLANRNLFAVANYHLGEYEIAIKSFRKAIESGDPVSALSLMYQSAAFQSLGDTATAKELLDEMVVSWPNFRPENGLRNFYQHPEHVAQILRPLRLAGWETSE